MVKSLEQIINEKSSSVTTTQERTAGTSNLEIETFYYNEKDYLKGKYYNLSNIVPDLNKFNFENAIVKNKKEKAHKESFQRYCNNFGELSKKGLGILLMGSTGNGKTFYSDCVYNELSKQGYVVYRTTVLDIFFTFQDTFKKDSKINTRDIIRELKECDLIILDDLGSENISENWGEQSIYSLINFIITNHISLIISTNLSLEDLRNHLSVKQDGKLLDRIKEKCKLFVFDWESRRGETYKKEFQELY